MNRKRVHAHEHAIILTIASAQALGPNPRRRALILSRGFGVDYAIAFGRNAVLERGIQITGTGTMPFVLDADWYGVGLEQAIFVIATGAGTAGWVEIVED